MNLIKRLRKFKLFYELRKRFRFEPWFMGVLALVVVISFLLLNLILGSIFSAVQKKPFQVSLDDEKAIYNVEPHNIKEDFSLILGSQPSRLNGGSVRQNISRGQAIAVVIENYTPIRHQQDGLEEAAIVYETLAEGGITRLLAIYDGEPVSKIGPVRSARPYFITWASEYRAPFVHVGGSQAALNNLAGNFRVLNIDEFYDGKTVWRDPNYLAPHDAFTDSANILRRLNKEKYYKPLTADRFPFKKPDSESGEIRHITIDYSIKPYEVKYEYDPSDHKYTRYNGGEKHHEIKPMNILVQFVEKEVLDDIGRLRLQTHGAGNALAFRDGKVTEGTWEKDCSINSSSQSMDQCFTKFFDENGDEIAVNPGQVWIEVVPTDRTVNYF